MRSKSKVIGIVGAIGIFVGLLTTINTQTYTTYLPIIAKKNCNAGVSMAWSPGNLVQKSKTDFCAQRYFNSGTWALSDPNGIPVMRPGNFDTILAYLIENNYCGDVILFNEPDGQDNIDIWTARTYYIKLVNTIPCVRVLTPNAIDRNYGINFSQIVGFGWRQSDVFGYHIYQYNDPPHPVTYPIEWHNIIKAGLHSAMSNSSIIITEVGPSNEWLAEELNRYYQELYGLVANGSIEEFFVYAPHSGCVSPSAYPWCPHALRRHLYATPTGDGFTKSGQALINASPNQ